MRTEYEDLQAHLAGARLEGLRWVRPRRALPALPFILTAAAIVAGALTVAAILAARGA